MSCRKDAIHRVSNKTALVLSGGLAKGAAHLGIAKALYEKGIKPDIFVGASIGSIIVVLLALYHDPDEVISIYKEFVEEHTFPQMLPLNMFSVRGVFNAKLFIRHLAMHTCIKGLYLKDLNKPVYITATDMNTAEKIVFGPDSNLKITEILEAAISIPVIFKPVQMKVGDRVMALCDGGIRESCPITVAANIEGVKNIIAVDLGYWGNYDKDLSNSNVIDVFVKAFDIVTSYDQLPGAMMDDVFVDKKLKVRIINPYVSDIGPFELKKSAMVIDRAYSLGKMLFRRDNPRIVLPKSNPRIEIFKMGQKSADIIRIIESQLSE